MIIFPNLIYLPLVNVLCAGGGGGSDGGGGGGGGGFGGGNGGNGGKWLRSIMIGGNIETFE